MTHNRPTNVTPQIQWIWLCPADAATGSQDTFSAVLAAASESLLHDAFVPKSRLRLLTTNTGTDPLDHSGSPSTHMPDAPPPEPVTIHSPPEPKLDSPIILGAPLPPARNLLPRRQLRPAPRLADEQAAYSACHLTDVDPAILHHACVACALPSALADIDIDYAAAASAVNDPCPRSASLGS